MTREEVINILQNIDPQCQKDCPISRDDCAKQVNRCLVSDALEYASDFLSADVVEVVRCKNCKKFRNNLCRKFMVSTELTDYCSYGERKETE